MAEAHITVDEKNHKFAIKFENFTHGSLPEMFTGIVQWILSNAKDDQNVTEVKEMLINIVQEVHTEIPTKYVFPILKDEDLPLSSNGKDSGFLNRRFPFESG